VSGCVSIMTDRSRGPPAIFKEIKSLDLPEGIDRESIETAGPFNNLSHYIGYGIFLRDVVSITNAVAVAFYIMAAVFAMQESQYLGAGELFKEDGIFDAGLKTYQFFLVASILMCISNGIALGLSAMAKFNPVIRFWWPEHSNPDMLLQLIYVGLDVGSIILSTKAINIYTPDNLDYTNTVNVDCIQTPKDHNCAVSHGVLSKNVYAKLLYLADNVRDTAVNNLGVLKYDGPYFNDIISTFAIIFALRFGLSFLVLLWANYKPLYIFGFTRTVCNPLGCGDDGGKPTKEHVECGWTFGGLLSPWSNNQLGALRNHDWVGSLFFFVAFIILSMGLNDKTMYGSYVPKQTVLDNYAKLIPDSEMYSNSYGSGDGSYPPCSVNFHITHDNELPQLYSMGISLWSNFLRERAKKPSHYYMSYDIKGFASTYMPMNQQTCADLTPAASDAFWVGYGEDSTGAWHSLDNSSSPLLVKDYSTTNHNDSPTWTLPNGDTVTFGTSYSQGYQSGQYVTTVQCCGGSSGSAAKFEDSISARFETYAILMFVGSIFWAISAFSQVVALMFYNVRARPLSLVEPDGGYAMTVA
jgi:hypothetical protein